MAGEGLQSLRGKRVLVTGGTKGIGFATAKHLCYLNAKVMVVSRDQEHVDVALTQLSGAIGVAGDIGVNEDVERIYADLDRRLGGIDILINNAGVGGESVVDANEREWQSVMNSDLIGAMHMAQHAVERMKGSGGAIVNVGSMSAKTRDENGDVYVAAKSGLRGWSDSFGRGVAKDDIRVSLIEPGLALSGMTEDRENVEEKLSKDEMMVADDVARVILFVLSQPPSVTIPMLQVRPRMQLI